VKHHGIPQHSTNEQLLQIGHCGHETTLHTVICRLQKTVQERSEKHETNTRSRVVLMRLACRRMRRETLVQQKHTHNCRQASKQLQRSHHTALLQSCSSTQAALPLCTVRAAPHPTTQALCCSTAAATAAPGCATAALTVGQRTCSSIRLRRCTSAV
jgi:hypothetical protein